MHAMMAGGSVGIHLLMPASTDSDTSLACHSPMTTFARRQRRKFHAHPRFPVHALLPIRDNFTLRSSGNSDSLIGIVIDFSRTGHFPCYFCILHFAKYKNNMWNGQCYQSVKSYGSPLLTASRIYFKTFICHSTEEAIVAVLVNPFTPSIIEPRTEV